MSVYIDNYIKMGTVEFEGFVETKQKLDELLSKDPKMEKKLQGIIRQVLMEVRRSMMGKAKASLHSDPRSAYKAIKTSVYKRILGGNVSILAKKRAGSKVLYEPQHKGIGRMGGNRMTRSQRTTDLMSYQGADRGFILRFMNSGTSDRAVKAVGSRKTIKNPGSHGGKSKYDYKGGFGNRGHLAAQNWFIGSAQREMQEAAGKISAMIDEMINNELK